MIETFTAVANEALGIFGFGLCHQFPERTFDFGGVFWAVCARCSGIYVGLVFAVIALLISYRGRQRHGFMTWHFWLFLGFGLAFMGWDGVSSYAGWRETTNFLRWVTGITMGASLAPLVYYLLINYLAKRSLDKPVMGGGARPWVAVGLSLVVSFVFVYPLGTILSGVSGILAALAIVATFSLLFLILLGILKPWYRSIDSWRKLIVPGGIATVLGFLLIMSISLLMVSQRVTTVTLS